MGSGWFGNHRTIEEQMLGLEPALRWCLGKTVLDAGCAEGHIGQEFLKAGAKLVQGFDNNPAFVSGAVERGWDVRHGDINAPLPEGLSTSYDMVLALAILHKAMDVSAAVRRLAAVTDSLMVIRLPYGSTGRLKSKHFPSACELREEMPSMGFTLERTEPGPRGELVQYWRR